MAKSSQKSAGVPRQREYGRKEGKEEERKIEIKKTQRKRRRKGELWKKRQNDKMITRILLL
jgi:hypothetical protein